MIIDLGYLTLFSAASPIVPLLMLPLTLLRKQCDGAQLLFDFRRPVPVTYSTIGMWNYILTVMSRLSILTNALIIIVTSKISGFYFRAMALIVFLRFIELAGHPPDHLDSHHGVTYFCPPAVEAMLDLAHEYHLPIRSFPYERISAQDAQLAEQIRAIVEEHGKPRQPARMIDPVFDFKQGDRIERLKASLRNMPDGYSEMLCHVGYADGLTESYTTQREEELAAFTDPAVKALVEEEGIQLITFAELPA